MNFLADFLNISTVGSATTMVAMACGFFALFVLQEREVDSSIRMLCGLVIGVLFGIACQVIEDFPTSQELPEITWLREVKIWLDFLGNAFVGLIKMMVLPIVTISIVRVMVNLQSSISIKSIASRAIFWLLFTTGIASLIGAMLGIYFGVGENVNAVDSHGGIRGMKSLTSILLDIIPQNPIQAMIEYNIVAVVLFAFLIGCTARSLHGNKGFDSFANVVEISYNIVMKMTLFVIRFMPYAVATMMASVLISNGFDTIKSMIMFIGLIYMAMVLMFIVHLVIISLHGLSVRSFVSKSHQVWFMAFVSRSSVAALPMSISALQTKLGVNAANANFIASLGTTLGLNGCGGYFPALSAIFAFHVLEIPISLSTVVMIVLIAILGSVGIVGIPGSATMGTSIMFVGMGLQDHFYLLGVILAIDPVIDMARTFSNVSGAMLSAIITDKEMGTLDMNMYNRQDSNEVHYV